MRESAIRLSTQIKLFHPPPQIPAWPKLPREIRQKIVELLAQLLRAHRQRILTGCLGKEGRDE